MWRIKGIFFFFKFTDYRNVTMYTWLLNNLWIKDAQKYYNLEVWLFGEFYFGLFASLSMVVAVSINAQQLNLHGLSV